MKNMKKVFALVLVAVMVLALSATAFAVDVPLTPADVDNATITISNPAIGETYKVYKLFDAKVKASNNGTGPISYQGTIPASLADYFAIDEFGAITAKDAAWNANKTDMSDGLKAALKAWAAAQPESAVLVSKTATSTEAINFTGLPYGYYVVTSTQGSANEQTHVVSADSTNPNAVIRDKNTTPPIDQPKKFANTASADDNNAYIGDTITYTIQFNTANYDGADKILSYIITDDFAAPALANVNVTSITIGGADYKVNGETPQFVNGEITIPWVDANKNSLYTNGAQIVITYTATVAAAASVDGAGNTNKATIGYTKENTPPDTPPTTVTVEDTIYTYALAIKKVDENGAPLAGATFQFPFYVQETPAADGAYIYAGTTAGQGLINEITTPENGIIVVKGLKAGVAVSVTETKAPDGYNKLAGSVSVTPVKTSQTKTETTYYIDANGNVYDTQTEGTTAVLVKIDEIAATPVVVVNKTGAELPATGGVGTTIFYVLGGMMMAAAVVLLITKKRVGNVK